MAKALHFGKMIRSVWFAASHGRDSPIQPSCSTSNSYFFYTSSWMASRNPLIRNHSVRACYVFLSYLAKALLYRFSPLQSCQYPVHGSWHQTRRPGNGDITHNSRVLADTGCVFKNRYYNILGKAREYTKNVELVFRKSSIISSFLIGSKHKGYRPHIRAVTQFFGKRCVVVTM